MWLHWAVGALLWLAMVMPAHCQSGDSGDWGSGDIPEAVLTSNATTPSSRQAGDDPAGTGRGSWSEPRFEAFPPSDNDDCSVHFSMSQALPRRLKAYREEMAYLKALQHGNQAVVENLVQYVGAEMGEQRYEEVIQENIVGIREDHLSCDGVVQKAVEEMESQLEGNVLEARAGVQKIKEESLSFEGMLRATADIASRLESSSQALHTALTQQLRKSRRARH